MIFIFNIISVTTIADTSTSFHFVATIVSSPVTGVTMERPEYLRCHCDMTEVKLLSNHLEKFR